MIYIETPRLLLRSWKEDDLRTFVQMNQDPHVMEFFLKSLTEQESIDFYNRINQEFAQSGYGLYAIERKSDHSFIGYTGFHAITFDVDFAPGIEIGWRIKHDCWNQGYVTEAGNACLAYAKERLLLGTIWSFTSVLNKRSERVMQKIGMRKVKEFPHPLVPDGHPLKEHVLYQACL